MILRKKLLTAVVVFALSFIFIFEKNDSFAEERIHNADWLEKEISVECGSRPLLEVLQEISESLEVEIIFDANLATTTIDCSYTDSTVESIIKRIFKDYNKGILIDLDTRTITVQIFGVSNYILASNERSGEILYLPFLGDMSNEELEKMQALQAQEYQNRLNDDQDIVPGVNVTRGDLRSLHNKQQKEYQEQLNDPDAIVPGVGITRGELTILHEQQQKEYQEQLNDLDAIVPGVGITRGELKILHEQQQKEYQEQLNAPDTIVPGVGIARGELKILHEQQQQK